MCKINIRKAVFKDLKQVVDISKGLRQLENYPNQKLGKTEFEKFLNRKYAFMFVAEIEKKVVGYITAFRSDDYFFLPFAAVDKKFRHRGIAKMLLEKVEQLAKKEKRKYILFTAYTSNKAISEFAKTMNYKKSRTLIQYYKIM